MSSSPEMTLEFTIRLALLECCICRLPPKGHKDGSHFYLCSAGHIFCDLCVRDHKEACGGSTSTNCCRVLEDITPDIEVKCTCGEYVRYCKLKEHQGDCATAKSMPDPILRICRVKTELLRCSTCGGPHRPPVFKSCSSDLLVCSNCHRADIGYKDYIRCPELEYLLNGMEIRKRLSYCTLIGMTKGKAPPNVGRTDKHIADSNEEMSKFNLRIHRGLLDCTYCGFRLRPDVTLGMPFMCAGGHIFCRDCSSRHEEACISYCLLLDGIMTQMKCKCNFCGFGNIPYVRFIGHLCDPPLHREIVEWQKQSAFESEECTLNANLLVCSECNLPLRPPIFRHLSRDGPVCSACYRGDIDNYLHCRELDYLIRGITVECVACKAYIPFSTLAMHQLDDCPCKDKLQKVAPGSSARNNLCDEEEAERPTACNNCINGKNKQKASYEVAKMDKHIVHGDEVGNDDDSSDENHPESGMRVAGNAFKTLACNKKVKIATSYGQKTGAPTAAQAGVSQSRSLPVMVPSKPPLQLPCCPGTRLFEAAHNRNRPATENKCEDPSIQRAVLQAGSSTTP